MWQNKTSTILALKDLNCNYNNLVLAQSKIYLAQCLGLPLNYIFIYEITGPWSYDLLEIIKSLKPDKEEKIPYRFKTNYKKIIDKVNNFKRYKPKHLENEYWYRLLSIVMYFTQYNFDRVTICAKLKNHCKTLVENAYDVLQQALNQNNGKPL